VILLQRSLLIVSGILIAAFAVELALEFAFSREWQQKRMQTRPYYSWSFHTSDGRSLGGARGILKLMIHPVVGYTNLPNQKTPQFHINSSGFRGGETPAKSAGTTRVLVLGGSAAFGTGLDNDSQTFSSQLEKLAPGVESINAAVIGHRSAQELAYLVYELVDLEPDWVIALDGFNDFSAVGGARWNPWMDVNGSLQVQQQLHQLTLLVDRDPITRIANLPHVLFPRIEKRIAALRLASLHARAVENLGVYEMDAVAERYARNVATMARVASEFGARFLCVVQPAKPAVRARGPEQGYSTFRKVAEASLTQRGVDFVDLNDFADRFDPSLFMDEVHLDARGNHLMAEIVVTASSLGG